MYLNKRFHNLTPHSIPLLVVGETLWTYASFRAHDLGRENYVTRGRRSQSWLSWTKLPIIQLWRSWSLSTVEVTFLRNVWVLQQKPVRSHEVQHLDDVNACNMAWDSWFWTSSYRCAQRTQSKGIDPKISGSFKSSPEIWRCFLKWGMRGNSQPWYLYHGQRAFVSWHFVLKVFWGRLQKQPKYLYNSTVRINWLKWILFLKRTFFAVRFRCLFVTL